MTYAANLALSVSSIILLLISNKIILDQRMKSLFQVDVFQKIFLRKSKMATGNSFQSRDTKRVPFPAGPQISCQGNKGNGFPFGWNAKRSWTVRCRRFTFTLIYINSHNLCTLFLLFLSSLDNDFILSGHFKQCVHSPLSHGGHIVPGDQKSFVLQRQASSPWFPLRGLAW